MIKLIAFDLDGVLINSKDMHYFALNRALAQIDTKYQISKDQHLTSYDGLATKLKLSKLHKQKGLPKQVFDRVWQRKQYFTQIYLDNQLKYDQKLVKIFSQLKNRSYKITVASNAVRNTVITSIQKIGISKYVDKVYSNEDITKPKPSCMMYLKMFLDFQVQPHESLILEDSHIGRKSAICSGGNLMQIQKLGDVTLNNILKNIERCQKINGDFMKPIKWNARNTNVLIPMAGLGSRFQSAGYTFPKPLIQINGKSMIQLVVQNLNIQANFIYLVRRQHYQKYNLKSFLNLLTPNCKIIVVQNVTQGAACTTLLAKQLINNDNHLVIANSDQYVQWESNEFFYSMLSPGIDGGILTFHATHPKWSFVKLDDQGYVTEVAQKNPISNIATVGIYYWNKGFDYVKYAQSMIQKNIRTKGQFYVCPVFNQAIQDGKKIKIFGVQKMWGLGTPEDLQSFIKGSIL